MSEIIRKPIHIQTADELFLAIKFEKTLDDEEYCVYTHKINPFATFSFNKTKKRLEINDIYKIGNKRLKAINLKFRELEWLDG